jgi:hypothetical protein
MVSTVDMEGIGKGYIDDRARQRRLRKRFHMLIPTD